MRVSTDQQAKEGDGLPAQREALLNYVNAHSDMVLVGEYTDDGVSGTKIDRDELQRLLDDVRQEKVDLILVVKLDRWFRSIRHYINVQELLDKHGVGWIAIWEPIYDSTTPQGRLIINQMMSIALFEAEQTGQRIRQVFSYKKERGEVLSGTHPWGFKVVNKHLVPDESAGLIKQIFEQYAFTGNLMATTRYAQSLGYPHETTSFRRLLKQRKYVDYGIVPAELFDTVNRLLSINIKKSQKRTYIFSGLIVCDDCNSRMSCLFKDNANRYRCQKHYLRATRMCANGKDIGERQLEKYLLENLFSLLSEYVIHQEVEERKAQDNSKRIKALERKIDRLKELYVNELITLDDYKADRDRYQAEIYSLTPVSKSLSQHKQLLEDMDIQEIYSTFTQEEKRTFWRSIIKEIRYDKNKKITVIFL